MSTLLLSTVSCLDPDKRIPFFTKKWIDMTVGVAQFANLDAHSTLPPTAAILSGINLSLISVVAGASANTVTGVERFEACVPRKIAAPSISCFAGPSSPYVSITTITAGM